MIDNIQAILTIAFVVGGIFFLLVGSIGIVRLPGFYNRTHSTSKSDTLGLLLVITGLIIYEGWHLNSIKLFLILLFIALANPIGSHALARAAFETGLKPLFKEKKKSKTENKA
jgi:multicomponent Na+:H+ antiporter subunit G